LLSGKYYNKKKEKNLIQEETSKFSSALKFRINSIQLEKINLSDILLSKRKVFVTTCYFE